MGKSKTVIFLIVWFLWATGKDLDALVRYSITSDFYVLSSVGLPWLYFVMGLVVFLLNTASVFYLFRPQPLGYRVLFNALAAAAVQNVVTLGFAFNNIAGVREAYARGRELRGLAVREEAMDMIFTQQSMLIAAAVMLGLYALVAFAVSRCKPYFYGPADELAEA
ncbi:hypothetical protein ACW7G2_08010 [Luteimonas sp. A277]